jgi:hypothetical protein
MQGKQHMLSKQKAFVAVVFMYYLMTGITIKF